MTSRILRTLVAALIGAVTGGVLLGAPAHAAACPAGTGVTVVVNAGVRCDPQGGGVATQNFKAAGHSLRYASQSPGFVCRVDGAPASDPCVDASPADAYWGLFWSDGKSGTWVYSSLGVVSLRVPQGGSVAFVFQNSASRTWPTVAPPVRASEPAAAPPPSGGGAAPTRPGEPKRNAPPNAETPPRSGKGSPDTAGTKTSPTASPTASPPSPSTGSEPSASPSSKAPPATDAPDGHVVAGPSAETPEAGLDLIADTSDDSRTSAASWVVAGVVVAILAAAAALVLRRRQRESTSRRGR